MKRNHMMIVILDVLLLYSIIIIIFILLYQITFSNAFIITRTRTTRTQHNNNFHLQHQQQQISKHHGHYHHHIVQHTTTSSLIIRSQHYMTTTTTTIRTRCSNHVLYSSSSNNNNNKDNYIVDTTTTVDKDDRTSSTRIMHNNNNIDNLVDPDPSMLLSSYNDTIQQIGFIFIVIFLTLGTYTCINILSLFENYILPYEWNTIWHNYILSIPISILFLFGGSTHFILKETYIPMIPPKDTWGGLWPKLPTPYIDQIVPMIKNVSYEEYHVYWTGIAEISGGILLLLAATTHILPINIPSFLLFILLICITPANIYMATHNIQVPKLPPISYPYGHINRGIIQCILLAILYQLTFT